MEPPVASNTRSLCAGGFSADGQSSTNPGEAKKKITRANKKHKSDFLG